MVAREKCQNKSKLQLNHRTNYLLRHQNIRWNSIPETLPRAGECGYVSGVCCVNLSVRVSESNDDEYLYDFQAEFRLR